MAKILYKENCKSKNIIECIEGIEIELLNGQKALIYPKYSEKMLLPTYKIASWNAKEISEIDALKKEYSHLATEELLRCGSPAAEHVSNFHSDKYGVFNLPTLFAAMEIIYQREDINKLAETIEGAELLEEFMHVSSCFRCGLSSRWVANSYNGFADADIWYNSYVCVPTVIYRKILESKPATISRRSDIIKFLKENPLDRHIILATLLEDGTISIAELVKQKEVSLKKVAGEKTEELANACGLIVRYKDKINTKTVNGDAQEFLDNCSHTGIAGYGKHK